MSKEIPLYNKKKEITSYTMVDDDNYDYLMQWKWRNAHGYAMRGERIGGRDGRYVEYRIHRIVANCPDGKVVDHISGNTLDNRRCNLRICSAKDNSRNARKTMSKRSSQFKGVSYIKRGNKWSSCIRNEGKQYWLGQFGTELEAAKVYNINAKKYYGEFANLNNINEDAIEVHYSSYMLKYTGVHLTKQRTWTARVWYKGKMLSLGIYNNEDDAARAYNKITYKIKGSKATLNPVDNWEDFCITKTKVYKEECRFDEIMEYNDAI